MPRQVTAFSNPTVKRLRSLRDKKARRAEGPVPRRGPADPRRSAGQRTAARDRRFFAPKARSIRSQPRSSRRPRPQAATRSRRRRTSFPRCRGKDNPQMLLGAYRQPDTRSGPNRPIEGAAVDRRPGAARPGQYRHDPEDRRRGRRRRPDPDRRQRRPFLGRGGTRVHGRDLHAACRHGALARVRRLAAVGDGPAGRDQPQGDARLSRSRATNSPASC